jgi:hypothetical protein
MVKELTPEHKAALSAGRTAAANVKRYLKVVTGEMEAPKGVSSRERLEADLAAVHAALELQPTLVKRMDLLAKKAKIEGKLAAPVRDEQREMDLGQLEADFIESAKGYAEAKGYPRSVFVELGVPADVLDKAGL